MAPADRLTRVIDGVLRRLGDDLAATPQTARISGEAERFAALIESLASGVELEEALETVRERTRGATELGSMADADQTDEVSDPDED